MKFAPKFISKFPLFRRTPKGLTRPETPQADVEKVLADGFRVLSKLCGKLAEMLDAQRLERGGYRDQGKFLERLDRGGQAPAPERKP